MDKEKTKDIARALVKGGVGAKPLVGVPTVELLSVLVASPLEKRREGLFTNIGERLIKLEQEGKIDLEKLGENDQFIDIVLQACQNAIKSSETEKINCYKNIIENAALGEAPEKAVSQVYLNALDRYTSWHIKILVLFDDPRRWFDSRKVPTPNLTMGSLSSLLETAFPELKGRSDFYNLVWSELGRDSMHTSGSLQTMMSSGGMMTKRTTEFGRNFLRFIVNEK
jgi:hypothetical protein